MDFIKKIKMTGVLLSALLLVPATSTSLETIDSPNSYSFFDPNDYLLQINLTLSDPLFIYDFSTIGFTNVGFNLYNPDQLSLNIESVYLPDIGLQAGELLQTGFVLYDGTLYLQATETEPSGARAAIRTTYRMNFDGREMLGREFLRARFIRQGDFTEARARARARAASIADARLMRFVRGDTSGRWVRAVRAIDARAARADIRFMGRQIPDNVLGHYGYDVKADGTSYVWAVMDKNSRYAVGLNVDDDDDGVFNANDNCRGTPNPDQMDYDGDLAGDACDLDDDNDSVLDEADNCVLKSNVNQEDFDLDGIGDACDLDDDNDGVNDGVDQCPITVPGSIVDAEGCSIEDRCPCDNDNGWKNHGAYVRCVAHRSNDFLEAGLIIEAEKDAIVSTAAESACGK